MIHPVYSSQEVLEFTYKVACDVSIIDGDFIECGVAAGSQLAMMNKALTDKGVNKSVYGYDSYQGIPYATIEDESQPAIGAIDKNNLGLLKTTGVSSHSKESVIENFKTWGVSLDNVTLVEGWFQNTIPLSNHKKIALLRLDGDLYSSTKVCMEYLFPKLQIGGVLIIDDWELAGCQKAILEYIPIDKIIKSMGIAYYINQ
jgi:O-methyltransferase